ncbi:immunity protein Imm33 domain-containing protein [Pectobacterium brasiliense]
MNVVPYLFLPEGTKFIIDRAGYEDVWTDETE